MTEQWSMVDSLVELPGVKGKVRTMVSVLEGGFRRVLQCNLDSFFASPACLRWRAV
jgi:hypothetical protein